MTKDEDKKTAEETSGRDSRRHTLAHKQLLAGMAAHVAASVVLAPSKKATSPEAIAEIAVTIAEAILQRAGL